MKFLALIASVAAIKLSTVPGPDIASTVGHGPRDASDTAPALCVDKATCGGEKSVVAYGPYKESNGGLTGNGHHLVFDHSGK